MWLFVFALLSVLGTCGGAILVPAAGNASAGSLQSRSGGFVQAAYFTNWGIYGANFEPTDIRPEELTHIIYSFADVSPQTGRIVLTDPYADEQKHFPGDSWDEPGTNLYGCLKQLYLLKLANRQLKVLLSVGGWTYSQENHFSFITDVDSRGNFVNSAVQMMKDYGFDGIDIDFEYPSSYADGQSLADLLTDLRASLDNLASQNGDDTSYEISISVPAGEQHYMYYNFPQMDQALNHWNLMAYDYAGSWLAWADNQANLYGGSRTGVCTDSAIDDYISNGASPSKILLGIPLYGRAFEDTAGIGQPYNGVGPGTTGPGVYPYKDLPLPGADVFDDADDVASYSYDPTKHELVSFDDPDIVELKAQYVISKQLGGCMFWELSMDKTGCASLVQTSADVFGYLDQTMNHIHYPDSKFDNIRNNMAVSSEPGPPAATPPEQTTTSSEPALSTTLSFGPSPSTTTSPGPSPTPTGGSANCAGVPAWTTGLAYFGGHEVIYGGHLWTAKWWTENDFPGGAAGVWQDGGGCA